MRSRIEALSLALSLTSVHVADASTWCVNPDGTGDAPTIQAAIDAASPGDEVVVQPGLYTWSTQGGDSAQFFGPTMLMLRDSIAVRGPAGPEATIIDAERRGRVVLCNLVHNGRMEGFTIRGGRAVDPDSIPEGDLNGQGGGILFRVSSLFGSFVVENCIIVENQAQHEGGAVVVYESSPLLLFNVIARNQALTTAGIRVAGNLSNPEIRSNTITSNFGTAIVVFSASATIRHNLIAENLPSGLPGTGNGLYCAFANVVAECNNIWMNSQPDGGCVDTTGISADPLFCATGSGYELRPGSPCLPENNACGVLIGAWGVGCTVTNTPAIENGTLAFRVDPGDRPTFSFALPRPDRVQLAVFDVRGRRVAEVVSGNKAAGTHRVDWMEASSRRPSGIYFARLRTVANGTATIRFFHVR